jgi:hypothetical protein
MFYILIDLHFYKVPSIFKPKIKKNNCLEIGAAHPNICRLNIEWKKKGAVHRNFSSVTVRCTFDFINSIFSTNIIATLSLS